MPRPTRRSQPLAQRQQGQLLEARYQQVTTQFGQLQAQHRQLQLHSRAVQTQYRTVQQECQWLLHVVQLKQRLIDVLLPHYPHALTSEQQWQVEVY